MAELADYMGSSRIAMYEAIERLADALSKAHGYADGYTQPAVFVFRGEEELFTFVQRPSMLNLWGAARRPEPGQVLATVRPTLAPRVTFTPCSAASARAFLGDARHINREHVQPLAAILPGATVPLGDRSAARPTFGRW